MTALTTEVVFSKSTKQWEARNGTVESFPAGPEGRRAALLCALGYDHPTLAGVVSDILEMHGNKPALASRLINAAGLVTRGHVYSDSKVKSQSSEQVYNVTCSGVPATWRCDCVDFTNGLMRRVGRAKHGGVDTDFGLMCKHSLARLLAELAGVTTYDQPIPF